MMNRSATINQLIFSEEGVEERDGGSTCAARMTSLKCQKYRAATFFLNKLRTALQTSHVVGQERVVWENNCFERDAWFMHCIPFFYLEKNFKNQLNMTLKNLEYKLRGHCIALVSSSNNRKIFFS